jgi:archaellum biogenesis ATPase FlaH
MSSLLIITSVENLQDEINKVLKEYENIPGVYVSLNKTQKSVENILKENKIKTDKLFFIDCVTSEKTREEVMHIPPNELDKLSYTINTFIKEIKERKFLIIDALATLLIYNNENKVAAFIKELTEYASANDVKIIALSPKTKGEELLNKIFNFFDKVKKLEK